MEIKKNYVPNVHLITIEKSEIDNIDFAHCEEPRETLKSFYDRQEIKPDLITNAGFFNMSNGESVFNYMDEKEMVCTYDLHKWGMGILEDGTIKYGYIEQNPWRDFISGYPNLLDNGEKVNTSYAKEIDYKARRTILGYNDDKIFILLVESPGKKFSDCQDILLDIGCKYAINLDGGGSTKCLDSNGKSVTDDLTNRAVDNVLCIYLKKPKEEPVVEKKVLYRVQTGAFGIENNAKILLEKIQSLKGSIGMDYSKAYIRKINSLYKVQVGAFSNPDNARKVVDDLKSLGYNSFITSY